MKLGSEWVVGAAGLAAAALVDRHIDDHRTPLHRPHHVAGDEFGRGRAGDQHRADHEVRLHDLLLDRVPPRLPRGDQAAELQVELGEPAVRGIEHGDGRAEPVGDEHRVCAYHAAADDDDLAGPDAGHATEKDAPASVLRLQAMSAGLDRHAAGDLAHRGEQGQPAEIVGHRLVGDGDAARFDQPLRLDRVGRQMQIGEEDLVLAQHGDLGRLGLLHLHDHVRFREHLRRVGRDPRAGPFIVLVVDADPVRGTGLDDDLLAAADQFAHRAERHAHPGFLRT